MFEQESHNNGFRISDANYRDRLQMNQAHYNSMRAKPINPQAFIDINLTGVRPFPQNWTTTMHQKTNYSSCSQEGGESGGGQQSFKFMRPKRSLFNVEGTDTPIHIGSVDSLTNRHLLDPEIVFPHEDEVYRKIGAKAHVNDQRNSIGQRSSGDKTYKGPEYSPEFYKKKNRNWRSERYEPWKNPEETLPSDLVNLLNIDSSLMMSDARNDYGYEQRPKKLELLDDMDDVKHLDDFKRPDPLDLPFKVLDVTDRTLKYRPKVTR